MMRSAWVVALGLLIGGSSHAVAEVPAEQGRVLTIDDKPSAHWVWVTDISYPNFVPGRAQLVDAARGRHFGMLTMGYGLSPLGLPRHGREIYSAETHYDRTARGKRTDVIAIYDPKTLGVTAEIEIPPKKVSGVTAPTFIGLTDDDRFMLLYNFTPAQSVSVVDLEQRRSCPDPIRAPYAPRSASASATSRLRWKWTIALSK